MTTFLSPQFFAAKLSWTFVSLAVVFPLTYEINQAFIRREHALDLFAQRNSPSRPRTILANDAPYVTTAL